MWVGAEASRRRSYSSISVVWKTVTPPGDPNPENLAQAVERLARRQTELEQRITQLEGRPAHRVVAPPPLPPVGQVPDLPKFLPPPPKLDESTVGLNWINRIAVVTLILGAAFL